MGGRVGAGRPRPAARGVQDGWRPPGGRHLIPCRAWIEGYERAWELLGARAEVRRFSSGPRPAESCPRLVPWLKRRPEQALGLADRWDQLLVVRWIDEHQTPGMYLRQVDVPGVDTKFIEHHRGVLGDLLDLQLASDRIDADATDFAGSFRFRRKPGYVRVRAPGSGGFTEFFVRAGELAAPPPGITRAYWSKTRSPTWPSRCPAARSSSSAGDTPSTCWSRSAG